MEILILFMIVGLMAALGFAIGASSKVADIARLAEELRTECTRLRRRVEALEAGSRRESRSDAKLGADLVSAKVAPASGRVVEAPPPLPGNSPPSAVNPPPIPPVAAPEAPAPTPARAACEAVAAAPHELPRRVETPAPEPAPAFDWENFLGAKLFAWAGGFTAFLGVAFFVRYSLQHGLIPPVVRAVLGFLFGAGLLVGGMAFARDKKFTVLRDALCGTGVVTLYAVTFACRAVWHFAFFGVAEAFGLMSLVTATAFVLAVRLNAPAIAVLGVAGGFLTPPLLATGQDNPYGLFGYIALLNLGLLAVALRQNRHWLALLGAIGTVLTELGWALRFFHENRYETLPAAWIAMGVVIVQFGLFLVATRRAAKAGTGSALLGHAALATALPAAVFALYFLSASAPAGADLLVDHPIVLFGFILLMEAGVFALGVYERAVRWAGPVAGALAFWALGGWIADRLTPDTLFVTLGLILGFALLHTVVPLVLRRLGKIAEAPGWTHAVAPLALAFALVPVMRFESCPAVVWPLLLVLDLLAVVLAALTGVLIPVIVALVLTLVAAGGAIFGLPVTGAGLGVHLLILGGFAAAFAAAGVWFMKRRAAGAPAESGEANPSLVLAPLAGALPFVLLMMVAVRIPLADPTPIFGLALALGVLLLGLVRILKTDALAPGALVLTVALEVVWRYRAYTPEHAGVPLAWHLGFAALYLAFPFVFHRDHARRLVAWVAAAAALPLHFLPVYATIKTVWPTEYPGLIPAAFALPMFAGLALILRRTPTDSPTRLDQLALFGAVALGFITLVFPIQFENQWLTLAWALEGAALVALHARVPHRALPWVGVALLGLAFVRLGLNPMVLGYHPRAEYPLLNWYLYSYGIVIAALAFAARRLPAHVATLGGMPVRGLLGAQATILAFVLLNLEIADYFSKSGEPVRIAFSGNFARDMTYAIAWALFAIGLLVAGIVRRHRAPRYAAVALLGVTLIKLFFHDLQHLHELYRVGAFLGVAGIAMGVSFLYQKFLGGDNPADRA